MTGNEEASVGHPERLYLFILVRRVTYQFLEVRKVGFELDHLVPQLLKVRITSTIRVSNQHSQNFRVRQLRLMERSRFLILVFPLVDYLFIRNILLLSLVNVQLT